MSTAARVRAYARQNHQSGRFRPTPAQRRRLEQKARSGK
jgi:hypothetical protein